jgi:hypothetical protein
MGGRHTVALHPPHEVMTMDVILENDPDDRPEDVVVRVGGWDAVPEKMTGKL